MDSDLEKVETTIMETLIAFVICAVIGGVIGIAIGDLGGKKNGPMGGLLGALLGPIGWIIVAVLPPSSSAAPTQQSAQPASNPNDKRIAALEAELKSLKSNPKPKAGSDIGDDGGIPTYKLD